MKKFVEFVKHAKLPGLMEIFMPIVVVSIGIWAGMIFETITPPVAGLNVLDLRYLNIQARAIFYLKSGENIPKGLAVLEVDIMQRKAHQGLSVNSNFEVPFREGERQFEWLIEAEWERTRVNLGVAPAGTLQKIRKSLENLNIGSYSSQPFIVFMTTSF